MEKMKEILDYRSVGRRINKEPSVEREKEYKEMLTVAHLACPCSIPKSTGRKLQGYHCTSIQGPN